MGLRGSNFSFNDDGSVTLFGEFTGRIVRGGKRWEFSHSQGTTKFKPSRLGLRAIAAESLRMIASDRASQAIGAYISVETAMYGILLSELTPQHFIAAQERPGSITLANPMDLGWPNQLCIVVTDDVPYDGDFGPFDANSRCL